MSIDWDFIKKFPLQRAVMTIVLSVLCLIVVKLILIFFDKCVKKSKMDTLIYKILRAVIKVFLLFTAVIIVLSSLGISVSSLVAAISIVGVAFSLAIQDFLSNVFGGLQIIFNHPFKVGDYITAGQTSGVVSNISIMYTVLKTPDNKVITIPNGTLTNSVIENYTSVELRRVDIVFTTAYDCDIDTVKAILLDAANNHQKVLKDPEPFARLSNHGDSALEFTLRVWCKNENYWDVKFDLLETVKKEFDKNGISIPYPQMDVHIDNKN